MIQNRWKKYDITQTKRMQIDYSMQHNVLVEEI